MSSSLSGSTVFSQVIKVLNKIAWFLLYKAFSRFLDHFLWRGGRERLLETGRLLRWGVYLKPYTIPGAFNGREAFIRERAFIRSFTVHEENVFWRGTLTLLLFFFLPSTMLLQWSTLGHVSSLFIRVPIVCFFISVPIVCFFPTGMLVFAFVFLDNLHVY